MATPRKAAPPVPVLALSLADAAAALSMGETAFRDSVLPHLRVLRPGGRVLVPVRELERYVETSAAMPLAAELAQLARSRGAR